MAREPWLDDGPATDPTLIGRGAPARTDRTRRRSLLPQPFDGYPYLTTRIGHTALRNIAVLPADWSRERLIELTRRQAIANQLQTCLCLGPTDAIYVSPDGIADASDFVPVGSPFPDGLALPEPLPETAELAARQARLAAFRESLNPQGFLVGDGLAGGRPATADDIARLSGRDSRGIPMGLDRCATCGGVSGEYLWTKGHGNGDMTPSVVRVHCACENHNRCARCGEPLAKSRLSSYEFNFEDGQVWYLAAYAGLSHRCAS